MSLLAHFPHRSRRWLRWLAGLMMTVLVTGGVLFVVGDFGIVQRLLNGVESRAIMGRSTRADRWGLQLLYSILQLGGRVAYPRAAEMLDYYCAGLGDTLRFDAQPLLRHPEVKQALRLHKPGITFRHQASAGPFYIVQHTDWDLYYAFDLLYIRWEPSGVVFHDNYFFQPLARHSYTRFHFGRMRCKLNDGLIRVAYPKAKAFIAYSKVSAPLEIHPIPD
ncbi:hypothetical protein [Hymenobacter negativus]|uniref:Uncharacterized protein n=1 Tax=Hymenobacter negativus TaxID=2795026 RepID=A0ABS3QJY5_9BACT|nr:hypothetical protein [Hymenobacter negativus]MBO2011406.1 hypothetical protein [Hymenobacter negativus]